MKDAVTLVTAKTIKLLLVRAYAYAREGVIIDIFTVDFLMLEQYTFHLPFV